MWLLPLMQGGLGNQLFIYFAAEGLRKKFPTTEVFYDFSIYRFGDKFGRRPELLRLFPEVQQVPFSLLGLRPRRAAHQILRVNNLLVEEKKYNEYMPVVLNERLPQILIGFFQHPNYFADDREEIKELMFDSYCRAIGEPPQGAQSSVAVHLRSYEEVDYAPINTVRARREYYVDALDKYAVKGQPVTVYTDSRSYAEEVLRGVDFKVSEHVDPLLDLFEMSRYETLICSNSSFSWWAAFISDAKVIYPKDSSLIHYPAPMEDWLLI